MLLSSADFFAKLTFFKKILSGTLSFDAINSGFPICYIRVAMVREKVLENEKFYRSGKSQGITFSVREI